ncbi:Copper-containing nitrite reductase [Anoxybacillus flavithermus]|nr:Copper-containing nitrite reductase [Anoxybacillus flavithermus]
MKRNVSTLLSVALVASLLAACSNGGGGGAKAENKNGTAATTQQSAANMLAAHKGVNQAPVPLSNLLSLDRERIRSLLTSLIMHKKEPSPC